MTERLVREDLDGVGTIRLPDGTEVNDVWYQVVVTQEVLDRPGEPRYVKRPDLRVVIRPEDRMLAVQWYHDDNLANGLTLVIEDGRSVRLAITNVNPQDGTIDARAGGPFQ